MEGTSFEEDWAAVAAGAPVLRRVLGRLHQAGSDQLGPMFAELDELKLLAEAGQVGVLDQGLSRGDVRASDAASPAGWVRPVGAVLPGRWRGGAGAGGRGGRQAVQRAAGRGGAGRAGAGRATPRSR